MARAVKKKAKIDRRKYNGGYRRGAGRPLGIRGKLARGLLPDEWGYVTETIVVMMFRYGQMRRIRTDRGRIALHILKTQPKKKSLTFGSYGSLYYRVERYKSYEPNAMLMYRVCKFLEKNDSLYQDFIAEMVPSANPPYKRSAVKQLKDFTKSIQKARRDERKRIKAEKKAIEDAAALVKPKKQYEIDMEEAAKARAELKETLRRQEEANADAIARYAREREKYNRMRERE